MRKHVSFRVTGFKRVDDVLDVIGRHGVRQQVSLTADHSRAEAVRQELRKEAIEKAIAQARSLAAHAGVKTGGIVDLATQPPHTTFSGTAVPYTYAAFLPGTLTDQTLIDARQPGELPRLRFTITANIVLAIRAIRAD